MNQLPIELVYEITKFMPLKVYSKLRATSKTMRELLCPVPLLSFSAYAESTLEYGDVDLASLSNDSAEAVQVAASGKSFLRESIRIKLDYDYISNSTFLFLAKHGHCHELIRIMQSRKGSRISSSAKLIAMQLTFKFNYNPELIYFILRNEPVDANNPGLIYQFLKNKFDALKWCSSNGHLDCLKLLIEKFGADVNQGDLKGRKAVHFASSAGYSNCLAYLINKGADVNTPNDDGWHPIHSATRDGRLECLKILLNHGASVNSVERGGWYPIHFAADNGHDQCLKLLLDVGANVNSVTNNTEINHNTSDVPRSIGQGSHAIHFAASNGHLECIRLLIDAGADINSVDENGLQPCHYAACDRHLDCLSLMIRRGAQFKLKPIYYPQNCT